MTELLASSNPHLRTGSADPLLGESDPSARMLSTVIGALHDGVIMVDVNGIVTMANDTETLARRFARLFAAGHIRAIPGGHAVETGTNSARILCLTPAAAAARYDDRAVADTPPRGYAALQIAVTDIAVTRQILERAGVAVQRGPAGSVWVGPAEACGTVLEFLPA